MRVEGKDNSAHSHGHLDTISNLSMQGRALPFTQGCESARVQPTTQISVLMH